MKEVVIMAITCPTCKKRHTAQEWNQNTEEIVKGLNSDDYVITPIEERAEGCYYRCPNEECQDEVITDKDGILRTQDDYGRPIVS